ESAKYALSKWHRIFQQSLEYGLPVAGHARDDAQHLRGGRQLLSRLGQLARARFEFFVQLCSGFADAVNVSSRLRCLRTKTDNACSALRAFARQDHLVGTATGPVGSASIEPVNPNTAANSLDHLVGKREHAWRNGEAQCLGGLEIDDQLELGRLHNR